MNEVIDEVFGRLHEHVANVFVLEVFVDTLEKKRRKGKTEKSEVRYTVIVQIRGNAPMLGNCKYNTRTLSILKGEEVY